MSTRSSIAVQYPNGSVAAVYCHFDGYLDGVGRDLVKNYNSFDQAQALVKQGDMSSPGTPYTTRGEKFEDVAPREYASFEEYLQRVDRDIDHNGFKYIFKDGCWKAHGRYEGLDETPKALLSLLKDVDP